jgi:streptogramin lyase
VLGLLAGTAMTASATASANNVFARLPAIPGHPDASMVGTDGKVYVTTNKGVASNGGEPASVIYQLSPHGRLLRTFTITGQDVANDHGVMGMEQDAAGRLYVTDFAPPRVLRIDLRTGRQETYAPMPDLPACTPAAPGQPLGRWCDNSGGTDSVPFPDVLLFDPAGNLYVTDLQQGTIFRIRPRSHRVEIWSQDAQFISPYGPNGIAFDAHGVMVVSTTATVFGPTTVPDGAGRGGLFHLAIHRDGSAGTAVRFFATKPGATPQGFAIARSGSIYVSDCLTNELQVVSPDGTLVRSWGPEAAGTGVGLDCPGSVSFTGSSILVTNLAYLTVKADHYTVLKIAAGERGLASTHPRVP